jgi:hypothetical protein
MNVKELTDLEAAASEIISVIYVKLIYHYKKKYTWLIRKSFNNHTRSKVK